MKCFIHANKEAVAACKKCGKGMCGDCSAYSGHSGICPECRLGEFKQEVAQNDVKLHNLKWEIIKGWFFTIILCWTIIGIFVGLYRYVKRRGERTTLRERNNILSAEIAKLEKVLSNVGGGKAFV